MLVKQLPWVMHYRQLAPHKAGCRKQAKFLLGWKRPFSAWHANVRLGPEAESRKRRHLLLSSHALFSLQLLPQCFH